MADPDLELGGWGLFSLPAFLSSGLLRFLFFTQNRGGGGQGPQAPPLDWPLR